MINNQRIEKQTLLITLDTPFIFKWKIWKFCYITPATLGDNKQIKPILRKVQINMVLKVYKMMVLPAYYMDKKHRQWQYKKKKKDRPQR